MAVYTHCCRAQPLRQLGFLVLHVTTSKNVFKMFYAKTFAKMLQNILAGSNTA